MMLVVTLMVVIVCNVAGFKDINGYYSWSEGNRTQLYCPNECETSGHPDRCCACKARRCWDASPDDCPISILELEYLDSFGNGKIVASSNATYLKLEHTNGRLTKVPDDICTFSDQLVILDLCGNRLRDVSTLSCLYKLDTLRLDDNLITEIDNSTFSKIKDLRVLSFKNNLIKSLSPNVINLDNGNILFADFSENKVMETVDITNVVHAGPFCAVNFTNTPLEYLTNELEYTITHTTHGPGDIILEYTQIGSFLNFSSLGVTNINELEKYFSGRISVDESSIACDCSVYPLLSSFPKDFGKYWPNIYNNHFYCQSPDNMKGKDLIEAYKDGYFDELTCDISENPDCPSYYCNCIEQPSQNKILVNCTDVGFTSMPPTMPVGSWGLNKIDLILAQNKIQTLDNRDYLERLVNLDLRKNVIKNFDEQAAKKLSATINFEDQEMSALPVAIKDKDPNLYTFGDHPVTCDCSNLWIGDWIRFKHGHELLVCSTPGNVRVAAENVDESTLGGCTPKQPVPIAAIISSVAAVITGLVMIIGLCYIFRYDILLLKRRLHKQYSEDTATTGIYDVFISFYTENPEVFSTVRRYLRPEMQKAGYSVFTPYFDIISGDVDHQVIQAVDMSQNFVIVLCNNYTDSFETNHEFKTIWTSFLNDKSKYVVVINFDNLDSGSVHDNRLKALRRTKYCLDFVDRDSKLMSRLVKIIGKPMFPASKYKNPVEVNIKFENDEDGSNGEKIENEEQDGNVKEKDIIYTPEHVFHRLARPKSSICNCQYRVCYLHAEAFEDRNAQKARQTNTPIPPSV